MRISLVLLAALWAAGCQSPKDSYDVPDRRAYNLDSGLVWQRLTEAIENEGLSTVEADQPSGRLVATLTDYQSRGWAACRTARVFDRHDDKSRRGRGRPVDRDLRLAVQIDDLGTTTNVDLQASFSERQINPFKNLPFRTACPSTGVLERRLLAAIDPT